jgi:hypothetical protein
VSDRSPGRGASSTSRLIATLEQRADAPAEPFDPARVADLPEPAQRYFLHAIRPGTLLVPWVRLAMAGTIRLGPRLPWLPFRARQTLAPPVGFAWEARVRWGPLRLVGADTYVHGRGETAFRLWDRIPVVGAGGPDVSRAARGRLAIEAIWQPAALLPRPGVTWTAIGDRAARVTVEIDGEWIPLTLTVGPDGRLHAVSMERWGNLTVDGRYALIPFGADVGAERTFEGFTVPSRLTVQWWYGTARAFEFFRATIVGAAFGPDRAC